MPTMNKQHMISHSLRFHLGLGCDQQKKHLQNGETLEEAATRARQRKKVSLGTQMKSQKNWSSA